MFRRHFLSIAALAGFPLGSMGRTLIKVTPCDPLSSCLPGGTQCTSIWCSDFQSFVRVPSNAQAYDTMLRAASAPEFFRTHSPITLYCPPPNSGSGVGTTHLLAATANILKSKYPRTVIISAERWVRDFIRSLESNRVKSFEDFYSSVDALFIDDIMFLSGKQHSQQTLAHCCQRLLDSGGMLAITYPTSLDEMEWCSENLERTILNGFQLPIMPPSYSESTEILREILTTWEQPIPEEAISLAAEQGNGNIRESIGTLRRLLAHAKSAVNRV